MTSPSSERNFSDEIALIYDRDFVPLIFEPYAEELASRLASSPARRLLEIAAGTGVVTRKLASALPASVEITATDLSPSMLARASAIGTSRPVVWRQADAMALPFADAEFDLVVCQFGAMFFPDRARAFAEARRVLAAGGTFLFSTWDRIEDNDFTEALEATLAALYPDDPPSFMRRVPHGYYDRATIERDLAAAGFTRPHIATVTARSRASSARSAATAFCEGSPVRNEIESRGTLPLEHVTTIVTEAFTRRFGSGPIDGKIQALTVSVDR